MIIDKGELFYFSLSFQVNAWHSQGVFETADPMFAKVHLVSSTNFAFAVPIRLFGHLFFHKNLFSMGMHSLQANIDHSMNTTLENPLLLSLTLKTGRTKKLWYGLKIASQAEENEAGNSS